MPSYHPFTVHVVNIATGEELGEYKVSQNGNKVECYIESTADTEFKVTVDLASVRHVHPRYAWRCIVDGQFVESSTLGQFNHTFMSSFIDGRYIGYGKIRRMKFSNTRFSGSLANFVANFFLEEGGKNKSKLDKLGQIEAKFLRVSGFSKAHDNPRADVDIGEIVNEKAKKALVTHSVQYFPVAAMAKYQTLCPDLDIKQDLYELYILGF
jgi:hypothetical protein